MNYLTSYKRLNQLIRQESFEPMVSWGLRMALSGTLPIIWGLLTNRMNDAAWIALTAEAVSWVELKGSFAWRVRTLLYAALLAVLFALAGTLAGANIWLSVAGMLLVGFFATLLKSIGDRASGLALCVYLMYIICNGYPSVHAHEILSRTILIGIGAIWPVALGIAFSLVMPAQQPYRRQIALIWRSVSELIRTMVQIAERNPADVRHAVLLKEKEVRAAINNSYQFFAQMAHQVNENEHQTYQLSLLRKAAGLVAINVVAISDELEQLNPADKKLRLKLGIVFNAMNEAVTRLSVFLLTLKPEERLLAASQINRLRNLCNILDQYLPGLSETEQQSLRRVLVHAGRSARLLENGLERLDTMGVDKPVFRSYSLIKTSFLLRPAYLWRNVRSLFSFNTLTTRYALRSAVAAALALLIARLFDIDHGYWIPLSVMIVKQPYLSATLHKAFDRVIGTLLGVLAGGLLLRIPTGLHVKESILFLSFVLMVYYIRRNYSIAVFVITVNLVLLFNIEAAYSTTLMLTRILCTIGGAMLAVASGFWLFPAWDKKWLPGHLASAVRLNYDYFYATFCQPQRLQNWTRSKRLVESETSNVFDSFNRYMEEPGTRKSDLYYHLAASNMRITRNLNNVHLEEDEKKVAGADSLPFPITISNINECLRLFGDILRYLHLIDNREPQVVVTSVTAPLPFALNTAQLHALEKLIIELKTMQSDLAKLAEYSVSP